VTEKERERERERGSERKGDMRLRRAKRKWWE
jgi:hypothetical protein